MFVFCVSRKRVETRFRGTETYNGNRGKGEQLTSAISITIVFRPVLVMRGHVCGRKTCDAGPRSKVYTTLDTLYP